MSKRDYYEILGVSKSASKEQIKKAYRRLARKYHPDATGNDEKAAEQFKEVQEAYDVLNDAQKRKNYDQFGHAGVNMGAGGGPGAGKSYRWSSSGGGGGMPFDFADIFGVGIGGRAGSGGMGGIEDLFEQMHQQSGQRGGRRVQSQRGKDIEHAVRIGFMEAILGSTREVVLSMQRPDGAQGRERLSVKIPAGVDTGSKIRLRGKGEPGRMGGDSGDLIIKIKVEEHPWFRREGLDVYLDVPLSITEAVLGTKVDVPTLEGHTTVTIPAGSSSGRKLRLTGKGVQDKKKTGDMYLVLKIVTPGKVDEMSQELLREFAEKNPQVDLRGQWGKE
jgi:DnaJ-class molecular chaperone